MAVNTAPLSDEEIRSLFAQSEPAPPNTFELALVLGGTVSAGAYTAGALDFLFEALDAWTAARDSGDPAAPKHQLKLRAITGTSGGGVNAAIAARALAYEFPPATLGNLPATPVNPFYEVWVKRLDLRPMLTNDDLRSGEAVSLLNGRVIDEGAAYIESFASPAFKPRSYLADPLRVTVTLTNLRGVPYKTDFGPSPDGSGRLTQTFVNHADHAQFAVRYPHQGFATPRPDEWVLSFAGERIAQQTPWSEFSKFARATGAFPVGLPPRVLQRPVEHYRYRVAVVPGDGQSFETEIEALRPDWQQIAAQDRGVLQPDYNFVCVDGGATNNEPIELARTALSGLLERNPRDGGKATRGVLLIDPFAGIAELGFERAKGVPSPPLPPGVDPGSETADGLLKLAGALIGTLTQQTRYDTRDLLLATQDDVYSRFMITPNRAGITGEKALATAGLGAFIGFASEAFRCHDYLLGRANCQAYLRTQFVLPVGNPIIAKNWTKAQIAAFAKDAGTGYAPLIPLMGSAAVTESVPSFPIGALNPKDLHEAIESRFSGVIEAQGKGSALASIATWLIAHLGRDKIADLVIDQMKQALVDWRLR